MGALLALITALLLPHFPWRHSPDSLAAGVNRARQVSRELAGHALRHDGRFPALPPGRSGTATANDYLAQLLPVADSRGAALFWIRGSPVCSPRPPRGGGTGLDPGACHWAYLSGQATDSNPARPLLLDPFRPGTTRFDPDLWDRKVIVVQVDGSARVHRMRLVDDRVVDGSIRDLLSPRADAWDGSGEDPVTLLAQPAPAR